MKSVVDSPIQQSFGALRPGVLESHLPSLDGMRAISILLVIVAHGARAVGCANSYLEYLGQLGVSIFLVISGLLITWLMIRERDATGAFSLTNFYIRRCLRILPVFWTLLLVIIGLKAAQVISIQWLDIFRAFTFTHNFPLSLHAPHAYSWWLGHTWSLSLEEQFYLLWPSLFAWLPKRVAPRLAVALALSGPLSRLFIYYFVPSLRTWEGQTIFTRIDVLMAGCASAFLLASLAWAGRLRKVPVLPALAVTSFFLFVADPFLQLHFSLHSRANAIFRLVLPPFEAAAIAVTLLVLIAGSIGVAFRVINQPAARHVGRLSYSLYLWQQLFLLEDSATSIFSLLGRLLAVYVVAFCSFNFLERPLLRLRKRFRHGVAV